MHKKTLLYALLAAGSLFTACKKNDNDNNTDQLANLGKATITGNVYANLVDTIGASVSQKAPANTVISAWIDTRDFIVNPSSANYAKRYYTATVDGSGNYKLVVDVSKYQQATVNITPQQFTYDVIKNIHGVTHPDSIYTVNRVFNPLPSTIQVNVYIDLNEIQDINYN